jgi:ATP-binding cassette, subfamily B, bacterial MsbA
METYLRVFRYANNFIPNVIKFFVYSFLGVIFGVFNILLMIPLLNILFNQVGETSEAIQHPDFALSIDYVITLFRYHFLQVITTYGQSAALLFICCLILTSVMLANFFRYLERLVAARLKVDVVKNIRMDMFTKITALHIGFFNSERKGDLISRITNDVAEVETTVINSLKAVMKEPVTIIVYFISLFILSTKLTIFTIIVLPLTGLILAEIIKRLKRKAKQSQESLGRLVSMLDETLGGMRVVKAFNARNYILQKADSEATYHRKVNYSIAKKNELASPLAEFMGVSIVAIILFYGGNLVLNDESTLSASEFLAYLGIFAQIIQPAKAFSNGITGLQKGLASARRIFEIIDTKPAIINKPNAIKVSAFNDNISFNNVQFAYSKENVLRNINLKVEKGKTIALVGPSGGGKSTLADLIPRFYDPTGGEVSLDGISLTDYDIESLRGLMGIVTQESILFNDTIFNNIAFGMTQATEEQVEAAAKIANAHHFIMESELGYQTVIGERGSKLSGGQRQRISIARAVLKNPPILILDEATSALDSESENLVQEALTKLMKNRTSIVIAHRLSTIQHADEIIVIQQGEIVERGTHQQLIENGGLYQKLNEFQKS